MKILRVLAAGLALTAAGNLLAHPGHGKELSATAAIKRAAVEVDRLVEEGKIEKSWLEKRRAGEATRRVAGEDEEWVVTFDNPESGDAGKRRLYVFLTASGDFVVANFSGK
jgi:hypothetical protein